MGLQTYETLNYTQGLGSGSRRSENTRPGNFIRRLAAQLYETFVAPILCERRARQAIDQLEAMDDRRLQDIGLQRWEIEIAVRSGMDMVIRNRGGASAR